MKKKLNILTSLLLAITITLGYAGIPVYKMICTEDGHISVSITHEQASCKHEVKDCCKPVKKTTQNCCDFNSSFLHLETVSMVYDVQQTAGHILQSTAILFAPLTLPTSVTTNIDGSNHAPPLLSRKQTTQSIIQVFRI